MNSISTDGINEVINEIIKLSNDLSEEINELENNLSKINSATSQLKSWNGSDASEIMVESFHVEQPNPLISNYQLLTNELVRYKYIWNINVNNSVDLDNKVIGNIEQNIEELNNQKQELAELNEFFIESIILLESQLDVQYTGNFKQFIEDLKNQKSENGLSPWEELKELSIKNEKLKANDEIYQKFHSKTGEKDFVDYALEELGNRLLVSNHSTKYAVSYMRNHPDSSTSKDDEWCAEFVSYIAKKSGIEDVISPYIDTDEGSKDAQAKAIEGKGEWHDSSDTSYQPKRGDIFYNNKGDARHTGIVVGSDNKYIYTIEGNTPDDNGNYYVENGYNKGGFVNTRVRIWNADIESGESAYVIGGYYTPKTYINNSTQSQTQLLSQEFISIKTGIDEKYQTGYFEPPPFVLPYLG